ncbi:hypothetical protein XcodCFBP4690_02660 [Xanthomonas codiaei]|uniref:Uncharacterized protein n=1 Tax=Xanthomonas codiaei TaxID=56463 RepID=A0A2S7CWM5_9XANT|nr:hypothetical protein XcodCFBP4690_02660 [Xanthomonas codiaei]
MDNAYRQRAGAIRDADMPLAGGGSPPPGLRSAADCDFPNRTCIATTRLPDRRYRDETVVPLALTPGAL